MSVKKAVWLVMKRNGANKDLRLLFSRYAAKRHFEYDNYRLRFHRRKMQSMCKLNPLVDVWRVCSELACRVSTFEACPCVACRHRYVNRLQYCDRLRMWTRFSLPLTY